MRRRLISATARLPPAGPGQATALAEMSQADAADRAGRASISWGYRRGQLAWLMLSAEMPMDYDQNGSTSASRSVEFRNR
ncbi:hypothetical protein GGTG_13766 [Gaeumannomyces tritici R3-111a-1]|uniref:Uncharacterized protein n=1 Tax=Gaeumannomyces tritici (strain R3-111a-1) TaxID=644352 RepID=J3PJS7_GAET3|nr:hypothetical protein GGTG_13766 [Gaeumannomyces tritici R3-111a-1]EJT68661.1 hypothetical protein GGTG_13766 [Gaeumannomyces tritici R3-111a-1]